MHASALEALSPFLLPGAKGNAEFAMLILLNALLKKKRNYHSIVLDVGSGSGYLTVCMAEMVGPQGHVVGGEHPLLMSVDNWITII